MDYIRNGLKSILNDAINCFLILTINFNGALSITTFSKMTFSIMTLSIMTFSIMRLTIMTLSMKGLNVTFGISDNQQTR